MAQKVLVVQTAFVGDLLLSIPLLRRIRVIRPNHEIHLFCRKGLGEFFILNRLVDVVFEIDKDKTASGDYLSEMQRHTYELILCPHQSLRSARIVSSLKASMKIGYKKVWNFFAFNARVSRPMHLPEAMRQLALLCDVDQEMANWLDKYRDPQSVAALKVSTVKKENLLPSWASMVLRVPSREELALRLKDDNAFHNSMKKVFELAQKNEVFSKDVIFIAPGSVWPTKRWTIQGYIDLGLTLRRRGYNVAIVGAANENEICQIVEKGVPGAINLCGQTSLFETFQFFQKGKALICNDSGAMHLAAAAGLPTVAIFGPTTLDLGYRPWQEKAVVVEKNLSCRPCGKHGGVKCPLKTHQCMTEINELMVVEAMNDLLKN